MKFVIIETVLNAKGWLKPLVSVTIEKRISSGTALEHSSLRGWEDKKRAKKIEKAWLTS